MGLNDAKHINNAAIHRLSSVELGLQSIQP